MNKRERQPEGKIAAKSNCVFGIVEALAFPRQNDAGGSRGHE